MTTTETQVNAIARMSASFDAVDRARYITRRHIVNPSATLVIDLKHEAMVAVFYDVMTVTPELAWVMTSCADTEAQRYADMKNREVKP